MSGNLIQIDDVARSFGGVRALKGVSLTIGRGTVHGLLGENGAGKSTLVRIIAGLDQPSSGSVSFEGETLRDADVRAMEERGVFLVTQEPMIVGSMTVADNLMLGRWPGSAGFVREREMFARAAEFLADMGLDARAPADTLGAVDRRKLNILRALHSGGKLIILDEPTTDLTIGDKRQLFEFMTELKKSGVSFLFISHYNEEILEICDEVSVLRDGRMIGHNRSVAGMSSDQLSEMVVGRDVSLFRRAGGQGGGIAWQIRDIRARGLDVKALDIAEGEIVGFAGLPGSGAKELGQALYGLLPGASGQVMHRGRGIALAADPAVALDSGIAFLAEDRLRDGFVGIQSVAENIALSSLAAVSRGGWVSRRAERELVARFSKIFEIKAASQQTAVGTLSGGNQQKVCLSRLMATKPQLIILNEPTRGIDVGVKEEVHRSVDRMTQTGVSAIVITSDIDEMLRVVDRVVMFADGRIVAEAPAARLTKETIFETAYSADGAHHLLSA
ncbi:sugar ABC transporter ATP-binding protein [Ponticoccus alexandrii]|uniref:ATP-binding cassette domain-containing protein n=1 Tax=Ponticoccus alexandrii TaxID=1943633 RepID=A0ABX7FDD3_9RHOB|nr:sugar ABC transporter ATP-binding protein [Ponticoccus alexandrii]QRF68610.1 ATP-binding cassette domain-containing protein [Ponticoccus alexandrii]